MPTRFQRNRVVPRVRSSSIRNALINAGRRSPASAKVRSVLKARTRTKTRTRTRRTLFKKVNHDGPISESYHKWMPRQKMTKLGVLGKLIAPQFYVSNETGRLESGIGLQNYTAVSTGVGVPGLWTATDMLNIANQALKITRAAGSNGQVPNPHTQKIFLKSCKSELMLTNQTNDPVHVQIYDVVARRDIADVTLQNPGDAWLQGDSDTGAGVPAYSKIIGSYPFQSPDFTNFWLVEKVFDINLHSGGHHIHRSQSKVNHVFSAELVSDALGTPPLAFGKLTRFQMVLIHGYPTNDSTTHDQIGTVNVAIDMVWRKQYEFDVFERSTTQITANNTIANTFTVGAQIISDAYSVLATPIQA